MQRSWARRRHRAKAVASAAVLATAMLATLDVASAFAFVPGVTVPTVEEVTPTSASFTGTVNPHGSEVTECDFVYGISKYLRVPCEPEPGAGESPVTVRAHVSGLTPGVQYEVTLHATNGSGPAGSDLALFTTPKVVPAFGRCLPSTGPYAAFNSTCTKGGGKYEFVLGPGPNPTFTTGLKASTFVLEGATKTSKVLCTHMSGGGEITGVQAVGLAIALTGCTSGGHPCASAGHPAGEVAIAGLTGTLGVIGAEGKPPADDVLGLTLSGAAEFECNGGVIAVSLGGTAIGQITPTNSMKTLRTWRFTHVRAVQEPQEFENGPPQQLTWTFGAESSAQVGLGTTMAFTTAEPIEISSII
jgi:hypothetical protein